MKGFDKILKVLQNNLGYVIVLAFAIILFAIFSDGLLPGLITAMSALIAYICAAKLYREFTKKPGAKK